MKRTAIPLIFAAAALLFVFALTQENPQYADANGVSYAYMSADTPLYTAGSDGYEVKVNLPATYFVSVLATSGYYYRVGYGDINGYVRQTSVEVVSYEPVTKYAMGEGRLKSGIASVYLYEKADLTAAIATVGTNTVIETYGKVSSSETVYYCRIIADTVYYYGYLSALVADFTMPPENDVRAVAPIEPDPEDPGITGPDPEDPAGLGELPLQIILVVCLVVPSIVIVMLLFTDKSKKQDKQKKL